MNGGSVRHALRRLHLGRALYLAWHWPRAKLHESLRNGGPIEQWRTANGRSQMMHAALSLPVPQGSGPPLELHVLTGSRFWYQTAFCLWTFAVHAGRALRPTLYDDGTLSSDHVRHLVRLFPLSRVVTQAESIALLDRRLPASRFPVLRERWQNYPNIRKILDVHVGGGGWKLVIDSDLLFFRKPDFLIERIGSAARPLHAIDCATSYGYSRRLMEGLAGSAVAELVNVGLTGLRSDDLDWDTLESWCRELIAAEGTHYYLEQALVAMLVAGHACDVAPASSYVTFPREPEASRCDAVMHHYVDVSKRHYFRRNWRVAIDCGREAAA